jgi:(R,R)-butanediol dehydrogenase/meso-butanediol dehydrogenase/diacetyl reductase/L-iditol 2-dehydrogenase
LRNDEDVLIKIAYSSICGSDPHLLTGLLAVPVPSGCGHEMSGTVVALGKDATKKGLKVGDKVTGNFLRFCGACHYCRSGKEQFCTSPKVEEMQGTQAEYIVWNEAQVFKIPDGVDLLEATLSEPLAIAVRAVEKADISLGDAVAISGGGGIGLMAAQLCKMAGASSVTVIEPVAEKRKLALVLGADYTIDPIHDDVVGKVKEITQGRGLNALLESSGNAKAAETALKLMDKGGHIVYFSMYPGTYELPLNLFEHCYHNEIRIDGMFLAGYAFPAAVAMLPRMNLKPLVSKVYALEDCVQAYADQMSGKYAKLIFDCTK